MIDYLLKFPSKEAAVRFGLASGFTTLNEDNLPESATATGDYALHVIGEHFVQDGVTADPEMGEIPRMVGDGNWWVMVRDLRGIELPAGSGDFIVWTSADADGDGNPVPRPADAPSVTWA